MITHRIRALFSFLSVVSLGFSAARNASAAGDLLTLVTEGKSEYVIVRPAGSSPSQVYAAGELQSFVLQMTGAKLLIQTDRDKLPAKAILLGQTRYTAQAVGGRLDLAALGEDGFTLRTRGSYLAIFGGPVRGTLYGVYELLEKYGGCRWYAKFHSVIPKLQTWTVPALDDTQRPAFVMREPFWWGMFDGDFAARCRANGNRMDLNEKHGGKIRFGAGLFVHTFFRLMPPSEFFKDHPEYYSEINGKRRADYSQLCLTNPDVVRIMTERVLARIRQDPTAKLFSVSQNDWHGYCTCKNCRAIDEREGSPSGTLINFVNQVAAEVEKEFPDVWIETLAYQYTRHPPKTIRPRRNVVPRLCSIECDFSLPLDVSPYPQNKKFVEDIKGWSALTDKLYVWDYTTNFGHYIGPHPNFGCLQGNVKFFRDNHVVGLFEQGAYQAPHAEFAELRAWILAKLLWNPDQDIEALYDDFFNGYYGPAADPVRTYFNELQALVKPKERILRIWSPMTSPWYTDKFFERAAKLWAEAERRVQNDPDRLYNVRMSGIPVIYARLVRWPKMDIHFALQKGKMEPAGVDPEYAALGRELLARLKEGHISLIAENRQRHQAFVSMLRGRVEGYKPMVVRNGQWKAAVIPQLGGRICSLTGKSGKEFLDANAGGVDFANGRAALAGTENEPYNAKKLQANSLLLQRIIRHRMQITRTVALTNEGMQVTTSLRSLRDAPQQIRPVLRVALELGDAAGIAARAGDQDWVTFKVPEDQTVATRTIALGKGAPVSFEVASAVTGRGMRVQLPGPAPERVWVLCQTRTNTARLFVAFPNRELADKASLAFSIQIKPLDAVKGLPEMQAAKKHQPDRLVIEEFMIGLGKPGVWGEIVRDERAGDGFAAKLFNTHYEWCMQWRVEPSLFEPGSRYKVRMRVRVEKTDRKGEAFWAGIYDMARRKGHSSIAPTTDQVKEKYEWYEVGTWLPEKDQYVWIGPGQFDKKGGKLSAIRAVYVDKFEFRRVK